jgi:hypothetical protein
MDIAILYSSNDASHQKAAEVIKKAVENLGILAKITERDAKTGFTRIFVNGFDLTTQFRNPGNGKEGAITYDSVVKALERTAW